MRKLFNLFAAALVMLAAASCEKNEVLPDNNTNGKVITLKATINNGETKTSLGTGVAVPDSDPVTYTYPVLWSEGDAIAVIQGSEVYKFDLVSVDNNRQSGTFELDNTLQYQAEFDASAEMKAFYPYDWVNSYGNQCIIPTEQTYAANSFGNGSSPMAAYRAAGSNGALDFQNLFGALKLQIKGMEDETVQSIKIESENIAGPAYFNINQTNQAFSLQIDVAGGDAKNYVTLKCEGVALNTNEATDFLISIPTGEHNFTITVNSTIDDIPKTYNLTTTQTIEAGVIKKMAVMDFNIAYIDETGAYRGDGIALPAGEGKTIIWAPVNCGYEPANGEYKGYPYGKLYQWGRKDGHGYSVDYDASAPEKSDDNPVPANLDADCFYTNWNPTDAEWPAESNPCPQGWRIPTSDELMTLVYELNSESKLSNSQWVGNGAWFYGHIEEPTPSNSKVFFPAAGSHESWRPTITNQNRNNGGTYWSSSLDATSCAIVFSFNHQLNVGLYDQNSKADGNSVRCVKE